MATAPQGGEDHSGQVPEKRKPVEWSPRRDYCNPGEHQRVGDSRKAQVYKLADHLNWRSQRSAHESCGVVTEDTRTSGQMDARKSPSRIEWRTGATGTTKNSECRTNSFRWERLITEEQAIYINPSRKRWIENRDPDHEWFPRQTETAPTRSAGTGPDTKERQPACQ